MANTAEVCPFHKKRGGGRGFRPSRPYGKQTAGKTVSTRLIHMQKKYRSPSVPRRMTSGICDRKNTGVFPYGKRRRTLLPIHTPRRERPLLAILCYVSLLTRAAENSLLVRDLSSHRHDVCNDGLSSQRLTPPWYVLALTVPFAWGLAPRSFEAAA